MAGEQVQPCGPAHGNGATGWLHLQSERALDAQRMLGGFRVNGREAVSEQRGRGACHQHLAGPHRDGLRGEEVKEGGRKSGRRAGARAERAREERFLVTHGSFLSLERRGGRSG